MARWKRGTTASTRRRRSERLLGELRFRRSARSRRASSAKLPRPEEGWVLHLLERFNRLETDLRGDDIYAVGRKTGPVRERYPDWLYA